MTKVIYAAGVTVLLAGAIIIGCTKSVNNSDAEPPAGSALTNDEKSLVQSAGFNADWAERTADGNYLIEDDILLTKTQLQSMSGVAPAHNFIIANKEQNVKECDTTDDL